LTVSWRFRYTLPMVADPLRKLPASWSDDPFRYGSRWQSVRMRAEIERLKKVAE